jgi:hypothetical protein
VADLRRIAAEMPQHVADPFWNLRIAAPVKHTNIDEN